MAERDNDNLMNDLTDEPAESRGDADDPSSIDLQQMEIGADAMELIEQLQAERDEAVNARQRALADFRNYQRRAGENEQRAMHQGASRVVRGLLPVLDHFDLALGQATDEMTVDQLLGGVRIVRDELIKAMEAHGVAKIEPQRGTEFDPNCHEAMLYQPADDVEPGTVVAVLQAGYRLGEMVLRPAKVALAQQQGADSGGEAQPQGASARFHDEEPGD